MLMVAPFTEFLTKRQVILTSKIAVKTRHKIALESEQL